MTDPKAAAEALEWAVSVALFSLGEDDPVIKKIGSKADELRAQAAASPEPIPIVDGSKPYYVDMPDGTLRKYLPDGSAASPAPVSAETQANRDAADVFLNEFYRVDSPAPEPVAKVIHPANAYPFINPIIDIADLPKGTLLYAHPPADERIAALITQRDEALIAESKTIAELAKVKAERDAAVAALEMIYDKYEAGAHCFDDADAEFGSYMGNAVHLDKEEEDQILACIPPYPTAARKEGA